MKLTRRDLLRFAAGSAAGMMFTPIPWKMLDDSAIWTQNWPWIPEPARGETTQKFSTCTLCGAGCGIRARCVNGMPVTLSGIAGHSFGNGTLCAAGLAAHHLAFHPLRVRMPLRRTQSHGVLDSTPITPEQAIDAIASALTPSKTVAILDRRPGRIVSRAYRQWLGSVSDGIYITPPPTENGTLEALRMTLKDAPEVGFDFEHASTIVSFGTPLFEGWGSPGRMMKLLEMKRQGGSPAIVQIEHRYSRTAMFADSWIPTFPGTEYPLALALLYVILHEGLSNADESNAACALLVGGSPDGGKALLKSFSPDIVSRNIGVPVESIVATARMMATRKPTIVLGGGDAGSGPLEDSLHNAFVVLNVALGSVGAKGGIISRTPSPLGAIPSGKVAPATSLSRVTDNSIDVLILDGAEDGCAIPWNVIERKLRNDRSLVVSFSPFLSGLARHADIIIPSPAPFEQWEDISTPFDAPATSIAVASPLMTPFEGSTNAADVIRRLSSKTGSAMEGGSALEDIKGLAKVIIDLKCGYVQTGNSQVATRDITSPQAFLDQLASGGVWFDDAQPPRMTLSSNLSIPKAVLAVGLETKVEAARKGAGPEVLIVPFATKATAATGQVSPILSKLFQESKVRPSGAHLFINPLTCEGSGLHDGDKAMVKSARGSAIATVHTDQTVMPGVALFPLGPDPEAINQDPAGWQSILASCVDNTPIWRKTPATLGRA